VEKYIDNYLFLVRSMEKIYLPGRKHGYNYLFPVEATIMT
jgi:hypothetical protein